MSKQYYYDKLKDISVIDTHEHLWDEAYRIEHPGDWSSLFYHYGATALKGSGMTLDEEKEVFSEETSHARKWEIFSKYFRRAGNTAYIKSVLIAIRDIYGIDKINCESMEELTKKIKATVKPGFHRKILKELCGIDYCMVNSFDCDKDGQRHPVRSWGDTTLLRPDLFADELIYPTIFSLMERETNIECNTLCGWLKAIDRYFEKYASKCCSIKIALGYRGALNFDPASSFKTAEKLYNEHYTSACEYDKIRPLTDFIFFRIVEKAAEYGLPLKFHTGLYATNDHINISAKRDNVKHLAGLAILHPECRFIAMHIAYPFQDQLVMAVKQISNLYADMSWVWVVDTEAAAGFLKKALCAIPVVKITAFGGDYSLVENTYGHLELARIAISNVLSEMENSNYFDRDEAAEAGRYLLRDSVEFIYNGI